MYDYGPLQETATGLIERFGRAVTLRKRSATGSARNPTFTNNESETKAVISKYNSNDIDGTLIKRSDKMCIMHSEVTPDISDRVLDGSTEYSIENVEEVKPGDTSLIYKVQLRR